jgi:hypothetical protein
VSAENMIEEHIRRVLRVYADACGARKAPQ